MRHDRSLVVFIESALDRTPFCACGAPMVPADHAGALYLECTTHDEQPRGFFARLLSLVGHDRHLLLAAEEMAA